MAIKNKIPTNPPRNMSVIDLIKAPRKSGPHGKPRKAIRRKSNVDTKKIKDQTNEENI